MQIVSEISDKLNELVGAKVEIDKQIAAERAAVVDAIRNYISILGITADELFPKGLRKPRKAKEPVVGPDGKTWSGYGRKPKWLTA